MVDFLATLLHSNFHFSEAYLQNMKHYLLLGNQEQAHRQGFFEDKNNQFAAVYNQKCNKIRHQPYTFQRERYTILFHGELYNKEINSNKDQDKDSHRRAVLDFLSSLFLEKGTHMFKELNGMFVILIWDNHDKTLYGARDHFGIKPLYYMETNAEAIVATNKKHILFSGNNQIVDAEALQHYLSYQYVPEPYTLTKQIRRIEPGHYFVKEQDKPIIIKRYFHAIIHPVLSEKRHIQNEIRLALEDAVESCLQPEDATGSFLSGGVDSSIIVALAKQIKPDIQTFSVGFKEGKYSETDVAQHTAATLGVKHHAYKLTAEEYISQLPEILRHLGDPLADPACVPLFIAAREAKGYVDGVLSGEGADEVFAGYNIYHEPNDLHLFQKIPFFLHGLLYRISHMLPSGVKGKSFLRRGTTSLQNRYIGNAKIFEEDEKKQYLRNFDERIQYQQITKGLFDQIAGKSPVHQMQYIDLHTWLPGDILLKADKMTKAHHLQLHTPFLDQRIFNIAKTIPVKEKVKKRTTKSILRDTFQEVIPNDILYRKKLGFPVPIRTWLRGELYDWARGLIKESNTNHIFDKTKVLQLLDAHARNKGDYARKLWTILMFMMWYQIHMEMPDVLQALSWSES